MNSPEYISLRVAQVIEETADARSLVFEVPAELAGQFTYKPGQFLTLRIPHEGTWLPRCYSLSSTPGTAAPPTGCATCPRPATLSR